MKLRSGFVFNEDEESVVPAPEIFRIMPSEMQKEVIKKMLKPKINHELFSRYQNDILDLDE